MAWLAVNKNGTEMVFPEKPVYDGWDWEHVSNSMSLLGLNFPRAQSKNLPDEL